MLSTLYEFRQPRIFWTIFDETMPQCRNSPHSSKTTVGRKLHWVVVCSRSMPEQNRGHANAQVMPDIQA